MKQKKTCKHNGKILITKYFKTSTQISIENNEHEEFYDEDYHEGKYYKVEGYCCQCKKNWSAKSISKLPKFFENRLEESSY